MKNFITLSLPFLQFIVIKNAILSLIYLFTRLQNIIQHQK